MAMASPPLYMMLYDDPAGPALGTQAMIVIVWYIGTLLAAGLSAIMMWVFPAPIWLWLPAALLSPLLLLL
jgi:hypothetical protein